MLKRIFSYLSLAFVLFVISCKKNNNAVAPDKYKLQLVSGSGQTDTIGRVLKNEVAFSATKGNAAIREGYLRFETRSCDNTPIDIDVQVINAPNLTPVPQIFYQWQLNQTVGAQTLKVILLDSVKDAVDSVTVTATGIAPSAGWHTSGCIPITTFSDAFAQLPSGRIFTATRQKNYPYYSDDNGSTWHAVTSFPVQQNVGTMVATKENEVFITIPTMGIYYSKDNGQSWQLRSTALPLTNAYGDLQCTASGVLIALTGGGPYYSPDKGVSWLAITNGVFNGVGSYNVSSSFAGSMTDGTIIAILNGNLSKSRDGGASWAYIPAGISGITDMIVGDNNYIYAGSFGGLSGIPGVFVSKDTGITWTNVYNISTLPSSDKSIKGMTEKNGIYYFYATGTNRLTRTSDFVSFAFIDPPVPIPADNAGRVSYRYIVTNDNHLILSTEQYGFFYQTP